MNSICALRFRLRTSSSRYLNVFEEMAKHYSSGGSENIILPKRIQREPTDILKALASTVQRDPTAAHYKYHDDPYLIPMSNLAKRSFALSKESGRKAAQWIRAQHPELFQHKVAFPFIETFSPKAQYDENSEVNEDILMKLIDSALVSDAVTVYQLLQKKEDGMSQSTKQALLELLCFYNCEDVVPEDMIEERWYGQGTLRRDRPRKTWKDNGMAETLFHSLETKDSAAYCTLLQGMTRFYQVDRAWQLYQEMQEKGIPLTIDAYNSIIRVVCFLRESNDLRWQLIQDLLLAISKEDLQPNIGTLNSSLEAISNMGAHKQVKQYALSVLAELRRVGIEPSLASYYFLLQTFCKEKGPVSSILVDIMNAIEGKTFKILDPKDTLFFVTAMDVCRNHLQDIELAHRVHKLLHTGDNYNLIGDSFRESVYYRHYFILFCNMEPLEIFMQFYNQLVPNIYIPESAVMEEIIRAVNLNGAYEYYPKLWSDMVIFDYVERANNVAILLNGMVKNEPQDSSEFTEKFAEIALDAWNKLELSAKEEKYRQFRWTGPMLGDLMTLCLRGDKLDEAHNILNKLNTDQNSIIGIPDVAALQLLLNTCISHNRVHLAIKCIQYSADAGFPETENFVQQLLTSLELSDGEKRNLADILGKESLETEATA